MILDAALTLGIFAACLYAAYRFGHVQGENSADETLSVVYSNGRKQGAKEARDARRRWN